MALKRIIIENFRSIKNLDFEPTMLTALIGRNNVGKSNILDAIELLLGERWPTYAIKEEDIHNHDEHLTGKIEVYFDTPIIHTYYGRNIEVNGFRLEFNATQGGNLSCIDENGREVLTQYDKPLPLSNTIRDKVPSILVSVNRDLSKILSASQWTILGKILKDISEEFQSDRHKLDEFNQKMEEATAILRINSFEDLENIIAKNVRKLTGFHKASIKFKEPYVLSHYKNLQLVVQESEDYKESSALEMGAGIQSSIVIALLNAYKELKRSGAILLIEEPEVYLHPHARRYFYSLLKELAEQGNQIFYTTHSPEFVDLSNYETIAIVKKSPNEGTKIKRAQDLISHPQSKEELKLLTQFDTTKNEMFFSNKVILVEGPSERFSLPYIFKLKGVDINREGISIIDVGGKENLRFFIKIVKGFDIPFVVLHDEDRNADNYSTYHSGSSGLNAMIESEVGDSDLVFRMDPDFEGIFGLSGGNKVMNAIRKAKDINISEIPEVINNAIEKLLQL
ncbi:MAG: ATP-dependent nuclease [Candidatus Helarchaeota archaeon]